MFFTARLLNFCSVPYPRFPACGWPIDLVRVRVNVFASRGARGQTRDSRGIYFPNYIEPVSHIAVDVRPSPPFPYPLLAQASSTC